MKNTSPVRVKGQTVPRDYDLDFTFNIGGNRNSVNYAPALAPPSLFKKLKEVRYSEVPRRIFPQKSLKVKVSKR